MSDEQARDQLLSCLEDVQDQLEDLHEVTSAVVVSQAMTEIKALSSRLQECQKYWDDEKRRYDAADKGFRLVCDERDSLSRRLEAIRTQFRKIDGLYDWCDGTVGSHPVNSEDWLDLEDTIFGMPENWPPVVEKHERICGVPDPDDECEECIRPLGHDGEHDFSTPPE